MTLKSCVAAALTIWSRAISQIQHRNLLGSDSVIVLVIIMHLVEGVQFFVTTQGDWPIGMSTLLAIFHWHYLAGFSLFLAASLAAVGQWGKGMSIGVRVCLLFPQLMLLGFTAGGAAYAVWVGHFADGVVRPSIGILDDQYPRMAAPIAYWVATYVRIRAR